MRPFPSLFLGLLWALPAVAGAQNIKVDTHILDNGLTVLTHENHSAPLVSLYVFYRVGSVNEHLGITGISHLFEHMMFNGSSRYKPKEFDFLLESAGGVSNGYTDRDMTVYLQTFPPSATRLVLDLESDRMASMAITPQNLEQERGIVKEERRLRTDNDHQGKLFELLNLLAYVSHPYRNPVVGFMKDLDNITLENTRRYFDTYYTPNNAILVAVGDFDSPTLLKHIKETFGTVKKGPPVPAVYAHEPPQEGERRAIVRRDAELPMQMMGWHVDGVDNEADSVALDLLSNLLTHGESSRLYRSLVVEQELAASVEAWNDTLRGPSLFGMFIQGTPGGDIGAAEAAALQELEKLTREGPTEAEIKKARNQMKADAYRGLSTMSGRANQIGVHTLQYGDPAALTRLIDARDRVTAEDVRRVLKKYFQASNRTSVTLIPTGQEKTGPAGALPEKEALP